MKQTMSNIPCNPQGVGVRYPFSGDVIECLAGSIMVGGKTYAVAAKTIKPKTFQTKLAQTEVWLVVEDGQALYQATISSPGTLAGDPLGAVARLAFITIPAGKTLAEADGQIVTVEPMVERRATPKRSSGGEVLVRVWELVDHEVPASDAAKKYDAQAGTFRKEPVLLEEEVPVTI